MIRLNVFAEEENGPPLGRAVFISAGDNYTPVLRGSGVRRLSRPPGLVEAGR